MLEDDSPSNPPMLNSADRTTIWRLKMIKLLQKKNNPKSQFLKPEDAYDSAYLEES